MYTSVLSRTLLRKRKWNLKRNLSQEAETELKRFEGGKIDFELKLPSIAILRLNHPERRNAISGMMMTEFRSISAKLEELRKTEKTLKAVLFTSASNENSVFCSGGDLNTMKNVSDGLFTSEAMHEAAFNLRSLPLVTACYLNGRAIGGGAELTLNTNFRLFHPQKASLAFVQATMGLTTGWAGGKGLVEVVGRKRALELLLSTRTVEAEEAQEIGLCDGLVESEDEAVKWLENLVGNHEPEVVWAAKNVCENAVRNNDLKKGLEEEKAIFMTLFGGPANKKAFKSNVRH